ncbi:MAG TPA: Uma2 family endonuclease [Isosphaeraceae bacterium]|nr:Uma2 family endonuclease [Isosphaeraceae bacterium]
MATVGRRTREIPLSEYPTGDGKPMAETPVHRMIMTALIDVLEMRYAPDPMVYVSGNMLMHYVRNDKRRHHSPDVFLVKGIPKEGRRDAYFVWIEGKGPDVVFEITSRSTRKEDLVTKYGLYQDVLRVSEYFLFDPYEEYRKPSLQGFRLQQGVYVRIEPVEGRLYSEELGLWLEREGTMLRFVDPVTGERLLTSREQKEIEEAARRQAEAARRQAETERVQMADSLRQAEAARRQAEEEWDRMRRELEELRRKTRKRT